MLETLQHLGGSPQPAKLKDIPVCDGGGVLLRKKKELVSDYNRYIFHGKTLTGFLESARE